MAIENGNLVLFANGTQASYTGLADKVANTLYFTSDTHNLYLGSDLIGSNVKDASYNDTTKILTISKVSGSALTLNFSDMASASAVATAIAEALQDAKSYTDAEITALDLPGTYVAKKGYVAYSAAEKTKLADVATGAQVNVIESVAAGTGALVEVTKTNKVVTINTTGVAGAISDAIDTAAGDATTKADIALNAAKDYTDELEGELHTVAKSGNYNELINKPVIPSITGLATTDYVDDAAAVALADAKSYTDGKDGAMNTRVAAIEGLIESDNDGVINKFNEIVDFLDGVDETSLDTIITQTEAYADGAAAVALADAKTYTDGKVSTINTELGKKIVSVAAGTDALVEVSTSTGKAVTINTAGVAGAISDAIDTAAGDATSKANTAKSEAISAAAGDATSKANTAKSEAISAAAGDATSKVNAALASAKTYADDEIAAAVADLATEDYVDTAKSEAISAAAGDATSKANTAKSEAISAAAGDATSKANAALASAKTYADEKIAAVISWTTF